MKIPPCGMPFAKPPVSAWLDLADKASLSLPRVTEKWLAGDCVHTPADSKCDLSHPFLS